MDVYTHQVWFWYIIWSIFLWAILTNPSSMSFLANLTFRGYSRSRSQLQVAYLDVPIRSGGIIVFRCRWDPLPILLWIKNYKSYECILNYLHSAWRFSFELKSCRFMCVFRPQYTWSGHTDLLKCDIIYDVTWRHFWHHSNGWRFVVSPSILDAINGFTMG